MYKSAILVFYSHCLILQYNELLQILVLNLRLHLLYL